MPHPGRSCEVAAGHRAGRLEGVQLPDLLWSLSQARLTGVLHVQGPRRRKSVYLRDGSVVFASSSDPNERLGEMLLRQGKIGVHQLEEALARLASGKRLGTLLVDAGHLKAEDLVAAVLLQVYAILLELLEWQEGEYRFEEGDLPTREVITLQMHTGELLLHAIRRIRSFSRIRDSVGPPATFYGRTAGAEDVLEGVATNEAERLVLERLVEGPATLETLCEDLVLSNFEIYQAVWGLGVLGAVERREPAAREASGRAGRLDAIGGLPEIVVELSRAGETGVLHLARRSVERAVHFDRGRIVFATSTDPDDGLVTYLLRRGVISVRDREQTTRRILSGKRVGEILRDLGALDEDDLRAMVREQIVEIVWDSFDWEEGDWEFVGGTLPSREEITLDLPIEALVARGLSRIDSWTRIIRGCGGADQPLALTPRFLDVLDAMGAGVDEWQVVNSLRRPQTPRRICRALDLDDFRICRVLWTLVLLGAVEPADELALLEAAAADAREARPGVEPSPARPAPVEPPAALRTQVLDRREVEAALRGAPEPAPAEARRPDERPVGLEIVPSAVSGPHEPAREEIPVTRPIEPAACVPPAPSSEPSSRAGRIERPFQLDDPPASEPASSAAPRPSVERSLDAGRTMRLSREEVDAAIARSADAEPPAEALDHASHLPEASWEPPYDVNAAIERFNTMHRAVWRCVRAEIGAGATNFARSCAGAAEGGDVLGGVELHLDGAWDPDDLGRALVARRVEDPWPTWDAVLAGEVALLRRHLGDARADDVERRLGEIASSDTAQARET